MATELLARGPGIFDPNDLGDLNFNNAWHVEAENWTIGIRRSGQPLRAQHVLIASEEDPELAEHAKILTDLFTKYRGISPVNSVVHGPIISAMRKAQGLAEERISEETQILEAHGKLVDEVKQLGFASNLERVRRTAAYLNETASLWAVIVHPEAADKPHDHRLDERRAGRLIGVAPYVKEGAIFAKPVVQGKRKLKGTAHFRYHFDPEMYVEK